jgi:hypothetical protein
MTAAVMTAEQVRQALWWHYQRRYAVLFEIATDSQVEQPAQPGHRPIGKRRRIDVLLVRRAPRRGLGPLDLLALEIKVSRSDFLADLRDPAKQDRWRDIAHRHAYVVPAGLVRVDEVPAGSGLLTVAPPPSEHVVGYDIGWAARAPYGDRPDVPTWLILAFAWRAAAAEAAIGGLTRETRHAGGTMEELRAALIAEQNRADKFTRQASRAADQAAAWRAAFAAAGGSVPCQHCGRPVRPRSLRGGMFSAWRHLTRAHEAVCQAIRDTLPGYAVPGPADWDSTDLEDTPADLEDIGS